MGTKRGLIEGVDTVPVGEGDFCLMGGLNEEVRSILGKEGRSSF